MALGDIIYAEGMEKGGQTRSGIGQGSLDCTLFGRLFEKRTEEVSLWDLSPDKKYVLG